MQDEFIMDEFVRVWDAALISLDNNNKENNNEPF